MSKPFWGYDTQFQFTRYRGRLFPKRKDFDEDDNWEYDTYVDSMEPYFLKDGWIKGELLRYAGRYYLVGNIDMIDDDCATPEFFIRVAFKSENPVVAIDAATVGLGVNSMGRSFPTFYEGDILEAFDKKGSKEHYEIKFQNYKFVAVKIPHKIAPYKGRATQDVYDVLKVKGAKPRVIGNIYDNPEFLNTPKPYDYLSQMGHFYD